MQILPRDSYDRVIKNWFISWHALLILYIIYIHIYPEKEKSKERVY